MPSLLLLLSLFVLSSVSAQTLAPIVVESTVPTQVGEVEHTEFTGSYVAIELDDQSREIESLAEVIAHESGVQFRQSGGFGSFSSITMRGASSAQTGVYFDGVLLNDASTGGVDLSQLELLNVERIDVYRGGTPIQLGSGNIGGAVNLRSASGELETTRALLGMGNLNTRRIHFSHQRRSGRWDTAAAVSHQESDNRFLFVNDNGTPFNRADDQRERRRNSAFERQSLLLKAGHQISELQRYDGSLQLSVREQGVPQWRNLVDNRANWGTGSLQLQLNRRTEGDAPQDWNHSERIYLNRTVDEYDDQLSQVGLGAQYTQSTSLVIGGRSYWEQVLEQNTLALTLDARYERLDHEDRLFPRDYGAVRTHIDTALQYSVFRLDDRLLFTPALRAAVLHDEYDGRLREGEDGRTSSNILPQLGVRWAPSRAWQFTANVGQYEREPTFFELFGDRGLYIGSEDLQSERGVNIDGGLQWQSTRHPGRSFAVTAFASLRDELIVSVYDARGIGRSENSGEARITGIESSVNWAFDSHWQARLNLTVQSAENLSRDAAFSGQQLPGEAALAGYARLGYQLGRWSAWYEADVLQDRYYDSANLLKADDQFNHNVGVAYVSPQFRVSLLLNNLGDDNAEDFNGFPKPGRTFFLAVTYNLDGDTQ